MIEAGPLGKPETANPVAVRHDEVALTYRNAGQVHATDDEHQAGPQVASTTKHTLTPLRFSYTDSSGFEGF